MPSIGPLRAPSIALAFGAAALLGSPASAAVCGETVSGSISAPGEVDTYPVQLAAGDVVSLTIGQSGAKPFFAPRVELRTASNLRVQFDGGQNDCGPTEACVSAPIPASGTYTLRVFDPPNGVGNYGVTFETLSGGWNGASNAPPAPVCGAPADGTRALACGDTIVGAIDVIGDSDTYTFLASAGDRIGVHGDIGLELFAPGGARVGFEGGSPSCATNCASDPLPADGVYTLRAPGFDPRSYDFTFESLRESFAGGSSAAQCGGTPLACNQTSSGAIDVTGDSDTFTFFAEAGDVPWLFTRSLVVGPADFGPRAERFAPDGSRLAEQNAALPQTGTYTLRITDGGSTPANAVGGYELSLVGGAQLGGELCPRFAELSCGGTVTGTLPPGGGRHFYAFSAEAGDVVSLGEVTIPTSAPIGLSVIGPDGTDPADFPFSQSSFPISSSGTHTVTIHGGTGDYGISLESLSGRFNGGSNTSPTPICGAVPDGTRVIGCGQTLAGAIDVIGDRDSYTFFAEAGDSVSAQVSPNGLGSDPFWVAPVIHDPNGLRPQGCGFGCLIGALPATGAYTLVLSAGSPGNPTGSYTVTFTRSPCASDCNDGVDNDGDSLVDFGADGGCTSADDLSELPECSDGLDNDGDGRFDFSGSDAGCFSPASASEDPGCDDGFDNDGDGRVDADGGGTLRPDASCAGTPSRASEQSASGAGCGLGPELVALLPLLRALRRRARGRS